MKVIRTVPLFSFHFSIGILIFAFLFCSNRHAFRGLEGNLRTFCDCEQDYWKVCPFGNVYFPFSVYTNIYGSFCVKDQSYILDTFRTQELRSSPLGNANLLSVNSDSWFFINYFFIWSKYYSLRHNKNLWANKKIVGLKKHSDKVY